MKRRDFFKSLAAASVALYAGEKVVEAAVPPPAPLTRMPAPSEFPYRKLPPWKDVKADPQKVLKELLKGCAAVSITGTRYALQPGGEYEVEYRYSKDRQYPTNLNHILSQYLSPNAAIKSVSVWQMAMDELIDLNGFGRQYLAMPTENRIIVTWVTT